MAPRKPKPQSQSDQIRAQNAPAKVERKDDGIPKNNLQAILEAEEKSLHRLLSDVRGLQGPLEEALAVVKTRREAVNKRLDQGVADGHPKGLVRKMLTETAVTGERKSQREEWEREVRYRQYLGLPAMTQSDLEARMPDAAKDEQDWIGAGYGAGLRGDSCDPKAAHVPDRFHQKWMEAWGEGQTKLALSLADPARPTLGVIKGGKGQDLGAEILDAVAEVEPEIVGQVIEDYEGADSADPEDEAEDDSADADLAGAETANTEPV